MWLLTGKVVLIYHRDMLLRQLALGGVLGAVLFYSIKFFKLYMLAQQQLGREDVF
jgi:hypothetical protein